jgi:hypothetical protein
MKNTTYIFNVYTYTNEFDFIIATKKTISICRASGRTAQEYLRKKYPDFLGYFIELQSIKNSK